MINKKILFVLALAFVLLTVQFSSAATNISSCQTISSSGIYVLNQSIVGASACMIIASSNVTFDCQGYTIIYGAAGAADGVGINVFYLAVPLTNITIRNCIIQDNNSLRANGHGIQFTRVSDSYIFNNSIQTNGTSTNYGISFTTSCNRNVIENNTINTLGTSTGNYGLSFTTAASDNLIIRNNITGFGTTTSSAIYFITDSDNNTVKNNNLTTISNITSGNNADPQTVNIASSDLNNITGNYIYAQGAQRCYGVYILTDAEWNIVENNNITANSNSGAITYGVYILRAPFTVVQGNNIWANGTGTLRGVVTTNAPSTTIQNNNINISSIPLVSTLDGILSSSASPYTLIKNNTIALTGVGTINGVSITTAHYSYIQNNTIIINGTGTTDNGIFSASSEYVYIQNNNIFINGTTTLNGISIATSPSNYMYNNSIIVNGTSTLNGITATNSPGNILQNNSIIMNGTSTLNGITITSSPDNIAQNNSIIMNGTTILNGILSTTCNYFNAENNLINISSNGASNVGIYLSASSLNSIRNNTMSISGSTPVYGIYLLYSAVSNIIERNSVVIYGTTANPAVFLTTGANENIIRNNTLVTKGSTTLNYGIQITSSNNNLIELNNISTNGTTTNYGIYILTQANNNTVKNNIINTWGTSKAATPASYGIYINNADLNNIIGNNITANSTDQTVVNTTNNFGIYIVTSSIATDVINNTIYNGGGRYNYGIYSTSNSRGGIFTGNKIYTGGTGTQNMGIYLSESHYNIFENNTISTSGSSTDYGIYLYSSSRGNIIKNTVISTSGAADSHAFDLLYLAAGGYPENNTLNNNTLLSISGKDLNIETAQTNGTLLVNQQIRNYSIAGLGGLVTFRNTSAGEISFLVQINGTNTTLSNRIFITNNFARIDEYTPELNKSAQITLYNIPTSSTELRILRNGTLCGAICTNLTSLQAGSVTFNVTRGGNYSITSASASPNITLNLPSNNYSTNQQNVNFNFTTTDDSAGNLNCNIYLDSLLNQTNSTTQNNTLTAFVINGLSEGNHSWYIECFDSAGNRNISETRNFTITIATPSNSFNYPENNSYINNVDYILLNYTALDSDLRTMTVWLYGDEVLLNNSENIANGSVLTYNWTALSLGQHNWSIIVWNGIKNSTQEYSYFNVVNITMNIEAGGDYIENPTVLIQGAINDSSGLVLLSSQTINISVYSNSTGNLVASSNITAGSNGIFNSIFTGLGVDNYTAYATIYYQGITVNDSTSFIINLGYDSGYNAGLIAGNENGYILGLNIGNITGFNLGNTTGFVFGNSSGFSLGNLTGFVFGNSTGYIIGNNSGYSIGNTTGFVLGNSTGYILGNATGFTLGNVTGFIFGNQTGFILGNISGFNLGNATGFVFGNNTGYILGNITGFYFGNTSGFALGNTTGFSLGNSTGYILGFNSGNITGFNLGNTTGFVFGNNTGFKLGNTTGFTYGNSTGFVLGNSTGYVFGNATGFTVGNTTGFILGNQTSFMSGNISGFNLGNNTGFVFGNNTGFVFGNNTGFILGNISGFYFGNTTGYNTGFTTGNTTGFNLGNSTGYILGFNGGNITGFNLGNTTGFVFGNNTGFILGNISGFYFGNTSGYNTGFTTGNTTGFILGNSTGYVLGNATGFTYGNITGFILGNQTSFMSGNISGFNLGNSTGFTLGNLTGYILGNSTGYNSGYSAGNTTGFSLGNSTGYILGFNTGNITGFTLGNTTGFVFGNSSGFNLGNLTGYSIGNTTGFVLGNSTGYILGNATGFTLGNITGFILGNQTSFISGNITGFNLGNNTGFVFGNNTGFILGNISGFYFGNTSGYNSGYNAGILANNHTSASLVLDKIASLQNITNGTISYNITLRLTNKGGSNATSVNITDLDYASHNFTIGNLTAGETITRSYLINFSRNSTTHSNTTSIAQVYGIDSYLYGQILANSSSMNLPVPSNEVGQQLTLIKNVFYINQTSTNVNYTVSFQVINSGGSDLTGIAITDDDTGISDVISLSKTQSHIYSGSLIISKDQNSKEQTFSIARGTVNSVIYSSNQIKVLIPGYGGGPNDVSLNAPTSVLNNTNFNVVITVKNKNKDMGQDFILTYWLLSNDETSIYSTGAQTLYVGANDNINSTTIVFLSPPINGTYKIRANVSGTGVGVQATALSTIIVTYSSNETANETPVNPPSGGGKKGGGGGGPTGNVIENTTCLSPYITFGGECCLDINNDSICDVNENTSQIIENETEWNATNNTNNANNTTNNISNGASGETPKGEGQFFTGIKNTINSVGKFFSSIGEKQSKSRSKIFIILGIVIFILLVIFVIRRILRRKRSDILEKNLRDGLELAGEGRIDEAREKYREIKKIYKSNEDKNKEIYTHISRFYNIVNKVK